MRSRTPESLVRHLHGPGPSPVPSEILEALSLPVVGHLDPEFVAIMDEVSQGLRDLFLTSNRLTFPVSGTGSAGMEATVFNLLEPGDTAVIGVKGVFGGRMAEEARRAGAEVVVVEGEWGRAIPTEQLVDAAKAHDAKVVGIVHAETSTGVRQPVEELRPALGPDPYLLVDTVTGLGGIPVRVDDWGIDACYSGTQKCLSVPPGLAPVTFSDRAVAMIAERSTPIRSWYLDTTLLSAYWDDADTARAYHHTAPISMVYAIHEGLRMILDEGLEATWARHADAGRRLQDGLEERGFALLAPEEYRLPQLTTAFLPDDIDEGVARRRLLEEHRIEVGGGLGPFAGRLWRIGMMGHGATIEAADRLLGAIDAIRN
ncbi:MAG: alanine--glyoxylate aminotransferase family protein [Acidimicrobiia bacterium]|nr:alanine--glyoxylate aminotransferase family protein [Acidimicrobiia bacterium]